MEPSAPEKRKIETNQKITASFFYRSEKSQNIEISYNKTKTPLASGRKPSPRRFGRAQRPDRKQKMMNKWKFRDLLNLEIDLLI